MSQKLVTDHDHWLDRYIHFWQDLNSARKLIALNLRAMNGEIYIFVTGYTFFKDMDWARC